MGSFFPGNFGWVGWNARFMGNKFVFSLTGRLNGKKFPALLFNLGKFE